MDMHLLLSLCRVSRSKQSRGKISLTSRINFSFLCGKKINACRSESIWAWAFAIPWAPTITDPLMSIHCNSFVVSVSGLKLGHFSQSWKKKFANYDEKKKKKSGSYKGPRDGKLSPGNPRGKLSFPLRMPPEGEKREIEMENSPTAINKGAEYVGKNKPYNTTIRRLVS